MFKKSTLHSFYYFVLAYVVLQAWLFPIVYHIKLYNFFFHSIISITLFFLLINLNRVKNNPVVHKLLVSGFFFLFTAAFTSTLNEIFVQPWLLAVLFKDIGQLFGFILVSYAIHRWVTQNSDHSVKLKQLSEKDELTEVYTRRHFNNLLSDKLLNQPMQKGSFSILLINIDNFKQINESYTQAAGDVVLKRLAYKLKDCIRKTDLIARWEGEEFIILLNNSNDKVAQQVAEVIRKSTELLCVQYEDELINITVSIGAVTYRNELKSSKLVNYAEQGLFQAKSAGKNRVQLYAP
ncbi:GGDEF domain-containing protein [Psychromonas sp. B3M02]|uniref:GGDEF domain-containing protein n=1 Tax=Psychromonas sp. B3M02 TaxID=2267226 RepID=UPI0015F01E1C|nr:GGDEF domain-containing protein [Psychromonas sp. B3M02]